MRSDAKRLCHAVGALAAAAFVLVQVPLRAESPPLPVEEIAPGVYVHRGVHEEADRSNLGGIANIGFIVGDESVAVVDTGGSAAQGQRLKSAIRAVTGLPIRYVINTHVHPDHVFGNAAFVVDDPEFVGHAKLPAALTSRGPFYLERLEEALGPLAEGTEVIPPTLTVDDELTIDLGDRPLTLVAHPTAHTDNDLSLYDRATGTFWLSDLLFLERTPVIDGSLLGWLEVMETLRERGAARAVPGHGPLSVGWPAALEPQAAYLRTLRDQLRRAIADGVPLDEASETIGWAHEDEWLLFERYHPRNVVTAYTELEWE